MKLTNRNKLLITLQFIRKQLLCFYLNITNAICLHITLLINPSNVRLYQLKSVVPFLKIFADLIRRQK